MGMKGNPGIYLLAVALAAASLGASAAPRPAEGRVAFLQFEDKGCQVGVWDSKTRTSRIVGAVPECPVAVSVTSHEQVLVLIYPSSIRLADLGSGKIGDAIPMPAEAISKARNDEASLAGYTADGTLALYVLDLKPDDSGIGRLFLFKKGVWEKAAERACGAYGKCTLQPTIQARALEDSYGLGPNGLSNESLTADPYVLHRTIENLKPDPGGDSDDDEAPPEEETRPTHVIMSFRVDGKDSRLLFDTAPGEDTDGIYTFGLKLVLPDSRTLTITSDQFGSELVGHYLLFHGFFDDGERLYDVGTGEVVLDKLSTGGWLEAPPAPDHGTASPPP